MGRFDDGRFALPDDWRMKAVRVLVVGAGGSGSHVVADLAVLHQSLLDFGHPGGLDVTVMDGDAVSEANVGRARFYAADVGVNKAQVIVNRVNLCHGLGWKAVSRVLTANERTTTRGFDLVIGCVDTRLSRRTILAAFGGDNWKKTLYLDLGNGEFDGQVILGELGGRESHRLPTVIDLFPELLDPASDPTDPGPSCSRREALLKQSAFVNKAASMHAMSLLANLFRQGYLDHHGLFFDLKSGRAVPLAVNPTGWARMGYRGPVGGAAEDSEAQAKAA